MPTSPEAASVVERLRQYVENPQAQFYGFDILELSVDDLRALLAVVAAAKEVYRIDLGDGTEDLGGSLDDLYVSLHALYTADSAEERSSSKDAEGAKP